MIQVNNGKLMLGSIVFDLPEGFFINTQPETIGENVLAFYAPNGDYQLTIGAYEEDTPPADDLTLDFDTENYTFIEPEKRININGLEGVWAVYRYSCYSYFEAQLRMPPNNGNLYVFFVRGEMIGENTPIVEVAHSETVQQILHNIWPIS